ncbi:hypothetical protein [Xanthomonas campestris]|uniref:hypothetical protein n=1 Tax=Xanthomonas campestris TaxID=339 RepID=UPI001CD5DE7B|nr:hypothetical protein [Xanthomonas campestris]
MTEFVEKDVLGGWSIAVKLNGVTIGHIRELRGGGGYGYYKGPNNLLTWALQDDDLEALKGKVDTLVRSQ